MPPSGCPPVSSFGHTISRFAEAEYSNEDISKLHAIVLQAQKILPEKRKPTTALLSAYYSVLSCYNVDPDPGYRFVGLLFTIGTLKGPGTLFDKFERVLYEMGIEIELCSSEVEAEQTDNHFRRYETHDLVTEEDNLHDGKNKAYNLLHEKSQQNQAYKPTRRYSESAVKPKRPNTVRFYTLSSYDFSKTVSKFTTAYSQDGAPWTEVLQNSIHSHAQDAQKSYYHQHTGPRLNMTSVRRSNRPDRFLQDSGSLLAHKGTPRVVSRKVTIDDPVPVQNHIHSKKSVQSYQISEELSETPGTSPTRSHLIESESLLDIRASVALNWRLALFVKDRLQSWKDKAIERYNYNICLEHAAFSLYHKTLLRAVLCNWRNGSHEKRVSEEKEIYFKNLEEQAKRARDLYLLFIALSHWSNFAAEKVRKTALVRKSIIQTRYFNAWRDITVADNVSADHHFLSKYLSNWMHQYHTSLHNNNVAVQFYESKLLRSRYLEWLRELMANKASSWLCRRVKYVMFSRWIMKANNSGQLQLKAESNRQLQLYARAFRIWRHKAISRLENEQKCKKYYCDKISMNTILKWRKEIGVIPAKLTIQTDVSTRIQKGAIKIWLHRTREEQRASQINRSKILREAWINWRLQVRVKVLSLQINSHLMERTLRTLVIEARMRLDFRVRNEARLQNSIQMWKLKCQTTKQNRWEQEEVALDTLARKRQHFVLLRWYRCMVLLQQYRLVAAGFHRPQLLQCAMIEWTGKLRHLQKLDHWAQDARFFLIAAKTLSHWRAFTELTKREKRKTSYIQVRRIIKSNLARTILQDWQAQAQKILFMKSQATGLIQNRSANIRINIFEHWRYRVTNITNLEISCLGKALQKHFWAWHDRSRIIEKLKAEAVLSRQVHLTYQAIKKLRLKSLQVRAHENYAFDIYEKNLKRRYRRIFYFWHQQTTHRMSMRQDLEKNIEYFSNKNDNMSELGAEVTLKKKGSIFNQTVKATPKPGYLNTPSKRTKRVFAAATANTSTTPRLPPLTPVDREVRTPWSRRLVQSVHSKRQSKIKFGMSNVKTIVETPGNFMSSVARSKSP